MRTPSTIIDRVDALARSIVDQGTHGVTTCDACGKACGWRAESGRCTRCHLADIDEGERHHGFLSDELGVSPRHHRVYQQVMTDARARVRAALDAADMRGATGFGIGDRVIIRGGFEDGLTGVIVANEPHAAQLLPGPAGTVLPARPWRFLVDCGGGLTVGGLHPFALELDEPEQRCPECGARTTGPGLSGRCAGLAPGCVGHR